MKWILITAHFVLAIQMYGQNTFSKIYDVDPDAVRNYTIDFGLIDSNLYIYSTTFCDLEDTVDATCVAVTHYNMQGNLQNTLLIDSLNSYECCIDGIVVHNKELFMSTYVKGEKYKLISILHLDKDLNQLDIYKYAGANEFSQIVNEGIERIDSSLYIYSDVSNASGIPDSVQIIKTDIEGNEIWRKYYSYGNSGLDINNLQATPDGNLAFILEIKSPAGANNGFDGYQLMKIDTLGNVLDTFVFEDNGQQPNRLLNSTEGRYYFSTLEHPFDGWDPLSYGMINKMDANMDTLEWSLILPNDQLVDGRHYRMYDYIEASNGDIVACGMAYDNTDTDLGTGVPDKNSTWNGFIVRLTPDGEIKWRRLYKNDDDLLPHDEYGRFRPSRLNKIKELSDGRFVAAGDVFVNNTQIWAINEQETEAFHLWLLMVDENGCLDEYDCEEIIRIGNKQNNNSYSIGTKWTYESKNHPISFVGFQEYIIVDTVLWEGEKALVIEPGLLDDQDYMLVKNNKVYFWDNMLNDYQLNYDFDNDSTYYIYYYNQGSNQVDSTIVYVDSINTENINGVNHSIQYCRSTLGYGSIERPFKIISKVGSNYGGPRLPIGFVIDNITNDIQRLRCYENDTIQFNYVELSCDSTWITTSLYDIESKAITVHPNPTYEGVWIDGIEGEVEYELYSFDGSLIKKGITLDKYIIIENEGLYLLHVKMKDNWNWKRVVKLK